MKKIVFLIPSLGMGGMERVLVNYANILTKYNYDVTVLNFTFSDQDLKSLISKKVHYVDSYVPVPHISHAGIKNILKCNFRILPWIKWIQFHSAKYLYKKYIKEYFDVEVGFCGSPAIKIVSGSDNPNSQKLGWIHGDNILNDVPQAGGIRKAKKIYTEIQKIICVSNIALENIKTVFKRDKGVYKLANPNDIESIKKLCKIPVKEKTDKFTFICIGRISFFEKGFDKVMEATDRLKKEGYDFYTWFIGDGVDFPKLKEIKEKRKLDNVILFGNQINPYKYLNAADLLICPSNYEAYGMVIAEALILNKPIISTDTFGPSEILDNGKYGMIVENSVKGVYEGMKAVLSDQKLLFDLESKSTKGSRLFDPKNTVENFEKILRDDS